jgi:hypothetical protein
MLEPRAPLRGFLGVQNIYEETVQDIYEGDILSPALCD